MLYCNRFHSLQASSCRLGVPTKSVNIGRIYNKSCSVALFSISLPFSETYKAPDTGIAAPPVYAFSPPVQIGAIQAGSCLIQILLLRTAKVKRVHCEAHILPTDRGEKHFIFNGHGISGQS